MKEYYIEYTLLHGNNAVRGSIEFGTSPNMAWNNLVNKMLPQKITQRSIKERK